MELSLAYEPTLAEVREALDMCANGKAVRPDEIPAELLKLRTRENDTILRTLHDIILNVWRDQEVPQE